MDYDAPRAGSAMIMGSIVPDMLSLVQLLWRWGLSMLLAEGTPFVPPDEKNM